MKDKIVEFLNKNLEFKIDFDKLLEKPKVNTQGDFAMPVFVLSKEMKKSPVEISKEIQEKLSKVKPDFISKIESVGPYLNFFLNNETFSKDVLKSIHDESLFRVKKKKEKILIEYPSPNTNKPLHLGHVRNMLLGKSITRILENEGYKVNSSSINNDRGIAICKSMLAYLKFGNKENPIKANMKSDHLVGKYYVEFDKRAKENPKLEEEAQEMLRRWEEGDENIIALWSMLRDWALEGFKETYKNYGINIEKNYFESDIYKEGKKIALDGLKKGIFEKDEKGAIIVDLEKEGLDKKVLLRSDGTSVYITQDLALAEHKEKDFGADKYIFIVGNEQEYHFRVLFNILEKLGKNKVENNFHFAYGMVNLPEGKMKSREGTVVDADDLLEDVVEIAKKGLIDRDSKLTSEELDKRAYDIGLGAISFFILKFNPLNDMTYNPKESLSFEGETGPYVQYTYARIKSILRNAKDEKPSLDVDYSKYLDIENNLVKILNEFPEILSEASKKYKPSIVANYLIKVSQGFNEFYQNCPILKEEEEIKKARLLIAYCTSVVLKRGLYLLGIETLEEM